MVNIKNEPMVLKILNNDIELDSICYNCVDVDYSQHEMVYNKIKDDCERCGGTGFKVTAIGHTILDFIKRHSK